MVPALIIISVLLMAVFLIAALAGGRAHDRQNAERERKRPGHERSGANGRAEDHNEANG